MYCLKIATNSISERSIRFFWKLKSISKLNPPHSFTLKRLPLIPGIAPKDNFNCYRSSFLCFGDLSSSLSSQSLMLEQLLLSYGPEKALFSITFSPLLMAKPLRFCLFLGPLFSSRDSSLSDY